MQDGKHGSKEPYESEKVCRIDDAAMLRHILHTDEQDNAGGNPRSQAKKIAKNFSKVKTNKANIPIE